MSKICCSARQKLDEDLNELDRQIKLQAGEITVTEDQRPAQAYMNTPMVMLFLFTNMFCGRNRLKYVFSK